MASRLDHDVLGSPPDDASASAVLAAILAGREPLATVAQPIIDLTGGEVVGFEMLSRFPTLEPSVPQDWFLAAARAGHGAELNALAVRAALSRRDDLPPNTFLSLNVDPDALVDPMVGEALAEPSDLTRVVIELTEHVPVHGATQIVDTVAALRERGAKLAVDDAGAGYANLRSLLVLRPELVKIDRGLVTGCGTDPVRRAVVQALGELAGRLDAWAVAEGIESETDLRTCAALGIALGQGWLLGRPAPAWTKLAPGASGVLAELPRELEPAGDLPALALPMVLVDGLNPVSPGVVCDPRGRPQSVVVLSPDGGLVRVPAMTSPPDARPAEVLQRALARPEAYRYAPVVCTDGRGRATGLVTMDHLVEHLLRRSHDLDPAAGHPAPLTALPSQHRPA